MYGELDDLLNEVEGALADTPPASKAPKPARAPRSNAGTARATSVGASSSKPGRAAARFGALHARSSSDSVYAERKSEYGGRQKAERKGGDDDLEDLLSMVQSASPPRKSESRDVSTIGTGGGSSRAATLFNNGSSREISSRSGLATSHGQKRCGTVYVGGSTCPVGRSRPGVRRDRVPVCCDTLRCTSCDFAVLRLAKRRWDGDADYMFFRNYMPDATKLSEKVVPDSASAAYCCQCTWKSVKKPRKVTELETYWVCGGHAQ